VLDVLASMKPDLRDVLFEDGALHLFITVLLNGRNINEIDGEGDEVALLSPMSGG
jgi:molybdopterin converting factor small subunit